MRGFVVPLLLSALVAGGSGIAADPVWNIPGVKTDAKVELALDGDRASLEIVYTGTTVPEKVTVAVSDIGSAVSHGAVVAREYGLPAVVNTRHATKTFRTGDRILLDGENGVVRLADEAPPDGHGPDA